MMKSKQRYELPRPYKQTSKVNGPYSPNKCKGEHAYAAMPVRKDGEELVYQCRRCGHMERVIT